MSPKSKRRIELLASRISPIELPSQPITCATDRKNRQSHNYRSRRMMYPTARTSPKLPRTEPVISHKPHHTSLMKYCSRKTGLISSSLIPSQAPNQDRRGRRTQYKRRQGGGSLEELIEDKRSRSASMATRFRRPPIQRLKGVRGLSPKACK